MYEVGACSLPIVYSVEVETVLLRKKFCLSRRLTTDDFGDCFDMVDYGSFGVLYCGLIIVDRRDSFRIHEPNHFTGFNTTNYEST